MTSSAGTGRKERRMNGDIISRRAAIDALCDNCDHPAAVCAHYPCDQYLSIRQLPTIDPVKRGKWVHTGDLVIICGYAYQYRCTNCNLLSGSITNYCPNCGAKMEGEEDED